MEAFVVLAVTIPVFGLIIMTVMPRAWQNVQGWLLVTFLGIPGFLVVVALLVNVPLLLFGVIFFLGIASAKKR